MNISDLRNGFKWVITDRHTEKIFVLSLCILITFFREIDLFLYPRLWAEEGKIFYSFARHHTVPEILLTVQIGYYTLFNNLVSILQAKFVPIEFVPVVSTCLGFFIQLTPVLIILFKNSQFWSPPFRSLTAIMIVLLTPPGLWLNTTNSHFLFGLITFLILLINGDKLNNWVKWIYRGLIIFGTLSGPSSMLLAPIYYLKAKKDRSPEKYIQTGIIIFCAFLQAIIIIYFLIHGNKYNRLEYTDKYMTIRNLFVDHFTFNISGRRNQGMIYLGVIVSVYFLILSYVNWSNTDTRILILSFFLVAVLSTLGSIQMHGAPRYGYLPSCILTMLFIQEIRRLERKKSDFRGRLGLFVFFCIFMLNSLYFKTKMKDVYLPSCPKWKIEVDKWRMDMDYKPKIHPDDSTKWFVEL